MVLDEQSGDHESYWKSSWEAHECLNKSIQQLLPLCHWRWAPPRLPPLLSRSCRPAPPSTTGFLSLLPAGPAGTQTAEEDRLKKRELRQSLSPPLRKISLIKDTLGRDSK